MKHMFPQKWQEQLRLFKREGLTEDEDIHYLQQDFERWQQEPKRKKGNQGQVKNPEKDMRTKPKLTPLPKHVRERLRRSDNESE
jgi:hypothetical protein